MFMRSGNELEFVIAFEIKELNACNLSLIHSQLAYVFRILFFQGALISIALKLNILGFRNEQLTLESKLISRSSLLGWSIWRSNKFHFGLIDMDVEQGFRVGNWFGCRT